MNFETPVVLQIDGAHTSVRSIAQAQKILTEGWPIEGGLRHRDAVETCLKVTDGHRSTIDAQNALFEAAQEAGILVQS